MPGRYRATPLGSRPADSRFCSRSAGYSVLHASPDFATAFMETVVRDRFMRRRDRDVALKEITERVRACISARPGSPLALLDLRGDGCARIGAPTDAVHARNHAVVEPSASTANAAAGRGKSAPKELKARFGEEYARVGVALLGYVASLRRSDRHAAERRNGAGGSGLESPSTGRRHVRGTRVGGAFGEPTMPTRKPAVTASREFMEAGCKLAVSARRVNPWCLCRSRINHVEEIEWTHA